MQVDHVWSTLWILTSDFDLKNLSHCHQHHLYCLWVCTVLPVISHLLFFKKLTGKCKDHTKKALCINHKREPPCLQKIKGRFFSLLHFFNVIFFFVLFCVCGAVKCSTFKYFDKYRDGLMTDNLFHLWNSLMSICKRSSFPWRFLLCMGLL